MNAERLYNTLRDLIATDSEIGVQRKFQTVADALSILSSSPQDRQVQADLSSAVADLTLGLTEISQHVTTAQQAVLEQLKGTKFFEEQLAESVKGILASNAMTPAVALGLVEEMRNGRQSFLTIIQNTKAGLEALGLTEEYLKPGEAELSFLIPRQLFDNHLLELSKELQTVN